MRIDKESIIQYVTKGGEIPARTFVPDGIPAYISPDGLEFNVGEGSPFII